MQQISSLVTEDSRTPIQKLRRHDLQAIAKRNGIKFDPSGPATRLVKLIEGSGIDVLKEQNFQRIQVKNESGMVTEIIEPVVKLHATAGKDINYDAIIEANAKASEKEDENTVLKKQIADLTELVTKMAEKTKDDFNKFQKSDEPKNLLLLKMHELRTECKRLGIKTSPKDKKADLIEKINGKIIA